MVRVIPFALCFALSCTFLTRATCGDGIVDQNKGETCDDNNKNDDDGCDALCQIAPGFVCLPGEECIESCGDGLVDDALNEECDDGDSDPGDGCSANCEIETGFECPEEGEDCVRLCGNNELDAGEDCDGALLSVADCDALGNQFNTGALSCNDDCTFNTSQCFLVICGNNNVEVGEECDDGNSVDNDGCTSLCIIGPVCDSSVFQNDERNFVTSATTGNCYFQVDDQDRDFNEAESDCASRGGHLASIADAEENNIVDQVANNQTVWIGANDQGGANEGNFVWTDGSAFVFDNFNDGEPSNSGLGPGEDCVEMLSNGTWNDVGCGAFFRRFVCEIEP